jgi:pyruvate/2-oxoglutarate dehydrogenase complex dihydrolipoamide dehydrogenase (E3) component
VNESGLDAAGVATSGAFIDVEEGMRAADGIRAMGDVTGQGLFTHVALYQPGLWGRHTRTGKARVWSDAGLEATDAVSRPKGEGSDNSRRGRS